MNLRDMTPVEWVLCRHLFRVLNLTLSPIDADTWANVRATARAGLDKARALREESPDIDEDQHEQEVRRHELAQRYPSLPPRGQSIPPGDYYVPPGSYVLHADFEQYRTYDQAMYGVEQRFDDSLDEGEENGEEGLESPQSEQNSSRDRLPGRAFWQRLKTLEARVNEFLDGPVLAAPQLREMQQQIRTLFDGKAGVPAHRQLHTLVGQTREALSGLAGEVRQLEGRTSDDHAGMLEQIQEVAGDLKQVCQEHDVLARKVYGEMRSRIGRVHDLAVTAIDGNRQLEEKLTTVMGGLPTRSGYRDLLSRFSEIERQLGERRALLSGIPAGWARRILKLEADHKADVEDTDANVIRLGQRIDEVQRRLEDRIQLIDQAFQGVQKQLSANEGRIGLVKERLEKLARETERASQTASQALGSVQTQTQQGENIMAGEDDGEPEPRD